MAYNAYPNLSSPYAHRRGIANWFDVVGGRKASGRLSLPINLTQLMADTSMGEDAKYVAVLIPRANVGEARARAAVDAVIAVADAQKAAMGWPGHTMDLAHRSTVFSLGENPWKNLRSFLKETGGLLNDLQGNTDAFIRLHKDVDRLGNNELYLESKK